MTNKRNAVLDLYKLFAILMVVLSHVYQQIGPIEVFSTTFFNFAWLFRMPAFILLAGYLNADMSKNVTFKQTAKRIVKKAFYYVWPYVTFAFIGFLAGFAYNRSLILLLEDLVLNPQSVLWFLIVLFFIEAANELFMFFSNKFKFQNKKFLPIAFHLLFIVALFLFYKLFIDDIAPNFLGIKLVIYYTPYFCIGYLLNALHFERLFTEKKYWTFRMLAIVFSFFTAVYLSFHYESIFNFSDTDIYYIAIRYFGSIASCLAVLLVCYYACKLKVFRWLSFGGRFTLEAYYLHLVFLRFCVPADVIYDFALVWQATFISTLELLGIVIAVVGIMYFIPFSHAIVFGKSYSFYKFERKLVAKMWHNKKEVSYEKTT